MPSANSQSDVIAAMEQTLTALKTSDSRAMHELSLDSASEFVGRSIEDRRKLAIQLLTGSIEVAKSESIPQGHPYHSRDPLTGIIQSKLEDSTLTELQGFSEGNPVVWIPAGIKGLLEHCRAKYPFKTATSRSGISIPNATKVALLADWGADNVHAKRIGEQAIARAPDYMIHLGDIYYSGSESECQTFLDNWPLRQNGVPATGVSFALNGNHEMYSLGGPYFQTVLPTFAQEASYFTLSNDFWQLQGLDTAYQPFSLSGGGKDDRLKVQWDWLRDSISANPSKRNIFLSHNQPVSAHMLEYTQAQPLMSEARQLLQEFGIQAIYGWFFGHEHRCTIFDDTATSARFRARCIGSGAIGHHPQEEAFAQKDETGTPTDAFLKVNGRALSDDRLVAVSTFTLLTLEGKNLHIEYIDEDGLLFYEEDWDADKKLW